MKYLVPGNSMEYLHMLKFYITFTSYLHMLVFSWIGLRVSFLNLVCLSPLIWYCYTDYDFLFGLM